ncbi:unnamed protein product [Ectocarpus sp. CCAP 1310/34]|nr:unnamed protein product [Ectocarpus sp. CCAP 1310/34]
MTAKAMGVVPILPIVLLALSGTPASAGSAFRGLNVRNEANLSETDNINRRSLQTDDSVCTTSTGDISGIQNKDVCCPVSCGMCGDEGCSTAPGGAASCCTTNVLDAGIECGEAPCVIDASSSTTPAPATPAPTSEVPMCDGGIVGIQAKEVCCSASCGSCGGVGCSGRDGGSDACCGGGVTASGRLCSVTGEAPCITGPAPTPAPSPPPTVEGPAPTLEPTPAPSTPPAGEVPMCDGGIVGIQAKEVCCSASCGSCGGVGCSGRDGGSDACCGGGVTASGRLCAVTGEAPCITGPAPTPEPTPAPTPPPTVEVPMCDGGIVGIQAKEVCCSASCGSCGGVGCSGRDGGSDACCGGGVTASGRLCAVTGEAPCITGPAPTPEPTPAPTPPPTVEAPMCDGGIIGIQTSDVCCSASCGSCGGSGCSGRDGGPDACCGGGVRASGRFCSVTGEAPCITGPAPTPEPTPAPTPPPTIEVPECDGGIVGIQASDVCCSLSCGSCGGSGCSGRDGGSDACCGGGVRASGRFCSVTGEAPCLVTVP